MVKRVVILIAVVLATSLMFISCDCDKIPQIKIAISKEKSEKSTTKYTDWLLRHNSDITYYNLYPMGIDSALKTLETCDGLLLTGGEDVYPENYGKIEDTARCGSFDRYRDSLEFALIDNAIANKIPIFGVCRGEQILNISQGGTLYIDIPTDFDSTVSHREPGYTRTYHPVELLDNTLIYKISNGTKNGMVLSNHHQGIEKTGKGLKISAYSNDSLPEAIEWTDTSSNSFLMAVQWHPEAMDTLHPLSAPLAKKFLLEASNHNGSN